MSSRDSLDEILEDHRVKWLNMLSELNDELITVPEMLKVKAEIISEAKQAIHQWALDIIGEDDRDYSGDNADEESLRILIATSTACNELRKEQRAKLKGDIDESR